MVNNTVIDWFEPWPEQALESVATVFLEEEDLPDDIRKEIVGHMVVVHQSVRRFSSQFFEELRRHNHVTPKNYLDYVGNYKRSLRESRKKYSDLVSRLDGGLQKLIQAAQEVDLLQKELSEATVVVEKATKECNELLEVCREPRSSLLNVMFGWTIYCLDTASPFMHNTLLIKQSQKPYLSSSQ